MCVCVLRQATNIRKQTKDRRAWKNSDGHKATKHVKYKILMLNIKVNFWELWGFHVVQWLNHVQLFLMLSNHLILCCPFLLLLSIFPSTRVFSSELALRVRWPNYWSLSFSISVLPRNSQGWLPLGLTGSISLQSKFALVSFINSGKFSNLFHRLLLPFPFRLGFSFCFGGFKYIHIYLFIWLCRVFIAAGRVFYWGIQTLHRSYWLGLSSYRIWAKFIRSM